MVYASLQEAWGGLNDDFSRVPPENPYVVKDAAPPNPANFNSFQKKHNFTSATVAATSPPPTRTRHSYFLNNQQHHQDDLDEEEEYSQISTSIPKVPQAPPPPPHHKKVECVNMIAHLQTCKICSAELAENTRNVFIREFVLFAGCGLIMFLFLDLIRKIAQKS